jgi:Protein of unknown function (DUF3017)
VRHSAGPAPRRGRRAGRGAAGPQEGPERRSRLDQVPFLLVLCGFAAGLAWMRGGQADVRGGTLVIAGVLLAAAVTRLGLPDRRAGLLASRARLLDVTAFTALGIGLLVAGLIFPAPA